jgi:hypothetical protein
MRYFSKKEFVEDIQAEYQKLEGMLKDIDEKEMTQPGVCGHGAWSIKDMLAHLHEWHSMALQWYQVGLTGRRDGIPAVKDIPALNRRIYEKHQHRPLEEVRNAFRDSHSEMMKLILSLSEKQLLTRSYYEWTRKNALITYLGPNMGSHYRWAMKHLHRWKRAKALELRKA